MKKLSIVSVLLLLLTMLAGCGGQDNTSKEPISLQATADHYTANLVIAPGIVGPNTYYVTITDDKQQAITTGSAKLRFEMEGMEHSKSEQQLKVSKDGKWQADGPHLMMEGDWQVELVWTDEQQNFHTFGYTVSVTN
ncbi:MAG: FixH family protein [Clostridia bacterium]